MHADCRQQIKCTDCGQAFSTVTSLSKHKRFCEGVTGANRPSVVPSQSSQARLPFPSSGVESKIGGVSATITQQQALHAAYMNLYGAHRSPFPFYAPLNTTPPYPPIFPSAPLPPGAFNGLHAASLLQRPGTGLLQDTNASDDSDMSEGTRSEDGENIAKSCSSPEPIEEDTSTKDDQPLDLSTKTIRPEPESETKREVKEEQEESPNAKKSSTPELSTNSTLHCAYPPQFPNSIVLDHYRAMAAVVAQQQQAASEKKSLAFQDATSRFMFSPRFPPSSLPNSFTHPPKFLSNPASPLLKLPKPEYGTAFTHGAPVTANRVKERYACKYCGKVFPRSANLTRHLRTHTGEQPYKCKYCERSFSISSNLQRHVRNIHNKERPFRCPLCDKAFGQQTNLDRHLKKHDTEGPNVCDSPPTQVPHSTAHALDEKDDSYFSEIKNFLQPSNDNSSDNIDVEDEYQDEEFEAKKFKLENNNSPSPEDKRLYCDKDKVVLKRHLTTITAPLAC